MCEDCLQRLRNRWIIDSVSAGVVVVTGLAGVLFYNIGYVTAVLLFVVAVVFVWGGIKRFKKYERYRTDL
jgi:hypothetical protein